MTPTIPIWLPVVIIVVWLSLAMVFDRRQKADGGRALKPRCPICLDAPMIPYCPECGVKYLDHPFFHDKTHRENARICNLSWFDDTIYLSDTDFSHCQFIRCKLIDDGGPFSMEECFMDSCTIQSANVLESQLMNDSRAERRYNGPKYGIPKRPLTNSTLGD